MTADRAEIRRELATELKERMDRAEATLVAMSEQKPSTADDFVQRARISAKAEGVRLARSYVEEVLREDSTP